LKSIVPRDRDQLAIAHLFRRHDPAGRPSRSGNTRTGNAAVDPPARKGADRIECSVNPRRVPRSPAGRYNAPGIAAGNRRIRVGVPGPLADSGDTSGDPRIHLNCGQKNALAI